MPIDILFLLSLGLLFTLTLPLAFRHLPREGWQVIATVPLKRLPDGRWQGLNLTWYGLLSANAYLFAVAMLLILAGSAGISGKAVLAVTVALLAACVPAASLVARIVEKKAHTLTVGGAVFVGVVLAPWIVLAVGRWGATWLGPVPALPLLAAMAVAYAYGEGLGRLACISFGCCYGKPLNQCRGWVQRLFRRWHFVFHGETKKIAYASGLAGQPVLPVQALTAVLYLLAALAGTGLFLAGCCGSAFLLAMTITQLWRVLSELWRADHRGQGRLSVYQWMGLAALPYAAAAALLLPTADGTAPQLVAGLHLLWQPATLALLQLLWAGIFLHTGRSAVTGALLSLHVHRHRV